MSSGNLRKWWEVVRTQAETDLFVAIARNPDYDWRSVTSLLEELKWDETKLKSVIDPYVKNGMILVKKSENGNIYLGYWERVGSATKEDDHEQKIKKLAKKLAGISKKS